MVDGMRTYCKENLLRDREFCLEMVKKAFKGKWRRKNYQRALAAYCNLPLREVRSLIRQDRKDELEFGLYAIVDEFLKETEERHLDLSPIEYKSRVDGLSGKTRVIGIMSVKQQCYEHIIVGALMPLFNAKITPHQYASMEGRGQVAGMRQIQKWVRDDNWSVKCSEKFGNGYQRRCKHYVKLDVTQCFPSISGETVMRFLSHDISKNDELIWAVREIMKTHEAGGRGLVIGSLLSQFLCNYLLSFAYRFVMGLHKERRGKSVKLVHHALFFMDDLILIGSDRRNLKMAVRAMVEYVRRDLGLTIKPNWHIKCIDDEPIDMMGYVIHDDGHVTVRARIFLRARRAFLKAARRTMNIGFAHRLMAYHGYFVHTATRSLREKLNVTKIKRKACRFIRRVDRRKEKPLYGQCNPVHRRICFA